MIILSLLLKLVCWSLFMINLVMVGQVGMAKQKTHGLAIISPTVVILQLQHMFRQTVLVLE